MILQYKIVKQLNLNIMSSKNNEEVTSIHEYLKGLINTNQKIYSVNLQFKSIKDLLPYLHHFQKLPHLKKLSLHGNNIKQLPADLTDVFPSLEELDLTNNPLLQNIQILLISLKTFKKLKHLRCFIKKQDQYRVGQQIKSLQFINNTRVFRKKAKAQFQFKNANQKTLYEFQCKIMDYYFSLLQFQNKYLGGSVQSNSESKFRQQISQISKQCLQNLAINQDKATPNIQYAFLFMAKFNIFDILKTQITNLCTDIYNDLGKFVKEVFEQQSKLFSQMAQLTVTLTRSQMQNKEEQYQETYLNQFQKQHAIIHRNATMQNQIKRMAKQKDQLVTQISKLQNHNKKLMNLLYQFSQGQASNKRETLKPINPFQSNFKQSNKNQSIFDTYKQKSTNKVQFKQTPSKNAEISKESPIHKTSVSKSAHKVSISKQPHHSSHNRSNLYHNTNYSANKSLSLNQLKQTINQIYQSKLKYDEKNFKFKMPRQTMSQYFFTFLSQKYGLRSLTIEAADNIISGIKQYLQIDNDIKVFYMIFKNQIDEQFRLVQQEIKATINKLLKKHIQSKMPYKPMAQINQIFHKKIHGDISYEQCEDLIKFLYNSTDAKQLLYSMELLLKGKNNKQIQTHNQSQSSKKRSYHQSYSLHEQNINSSSSRKLSYSIFQKQILNFQLIKHQRLLKPLVDIFKKNDRDGDGIVNQQQFINIVNLLSKNDQSNIISNLLQIIDPYNNRCITFTQMIKLAANYPQNNPLLYRLIDNSQQTYFNSNA